MKKWIKYLLVSLGIVAVVGSSMFGIMKVLEYNEAKRKEELERMEKEAVQLAYLELYNSFHIASGMYSSWDLGFHGKYKPSEEIGENDYGINCNVYLVLKMYESRTGVTLAYETVIEYFSQEFEPDDSLRLYNNGLHPEIEAYVEWAKDRSNEMREYIYEIRDLYGSYVWEKRDAFEYKLFTDLSPQMYDELAKKEADPNYELDLLSLQQAGY